MASLARRHPLPFDPAFLLIQPNHIPAHDLIYAEETVRILPSDLRARQQQRGRWS